MSNDDLLIDILKAAGHGDAAELAARVLAHGQPPAAPAASAAPAAPPARGNNDDPAQREGLMILDAMRSQGIIAAAPITPDSDEAA